MNPAKCGFDLNQVLITYMKVGCADNPRNTHKQEHTTRDAQIAKNITREEHNTEHQHIQEIIL